VKEAFTTSRMLEARRTSCHERAMRGKARFTQAGGAILAIAIIAGTVAGVMVGQSSIGFLVGAAAGIAIALLIWLTDRRR
jgi:hypothetical protein